MTDLWPSIHTLCGSSGAVTDDMTALFAELNREIEPLFDDTTAANKSELANWCPDCMSSDEIETHGYESICKKCGTILEIDLDQGAEYRWFSNDAGSTDPSRCGFPINPLLPESSLGTMILGRGSSSGSMGRIKRYHMWNLMPYRERNLWTIFDGLTVRATNAGISTAVIEETKELYARLTASTICRGQQQRDAMLAACLWEALKRHDAPRMPKDIADIFSLPLKNVTRGIKLFQHLLAMRTSAKDESTYTSVRPTATSRKQAAGTTTSQKEDPLLSTTTTQTQSTSKPKEVIPMMKESDAVLLERANQRKAQMKTVSRSTTYEDFIKPFLTNLSAPNMSSLEAMVRRVCKRIEDLGVVPENTPPSLTASVIAFCCAEMGITMDNADIGRVCGISPVTIQKCLKRIQPWRSQLLA